MAKEKTHSSWALCKRHYKLYVDFEAEGCGYIQASIHSLSDWRKTKTAEARKGLIPILRLTQWSPGGPVRLTVTGFSRDSRESDPYLLLLKMAADLAEWLYQAIELGEAWKKYYKPEKTK